MTLSSRHELESLPKGNPGKGLRRTRQRPQSRNRRALCSLRVPRPASGVAYTAGEIARMLGVSVATVRGWVSRGRRVRGGWVRLRTLRCPMGQVAPDDLCAFLERVNSKVSVTCEIDRHSWTSVRRSMNDDRDEVLGRLIPLRMACSMGQCRVMGGGEDRLAGALDTVTNALNDFRIKLEVDSPDDLEEADG